VPIGPLAIQSGAPPHLAEKRFVPRSCLREVLRGRPGGSASDRTGGPQRQSRIELAKRPSFEQPAEAGLRSFGLQAKSFQRARRQVPSFVLKSDRRQASWAAGDAAGSGLVLEPIALGQRGQLLRTVPAAHRAQLHTPASKHQAWLDHRENLAGRTARQHVGQNIKARRTLGRLPRPAQSHLLTISRQTGHSVLPHGRAAAAPSALAMRAWACVGQEKTTSSINARHRPGARAAGAGCHRQLLGRAATVARTARK